MSISNNSRQRFRNIMSNIEMADEIIDAINNLILQNGQDVAENSTSSSDGTDTLIFNENIQQIILPLEGEEHYLFYKLIVKYRAKNSAGFSGILIKSFLVSADKKTNNYMILGPVQSDLTIPGHKNIDVRVSILNNILFVHGINSESENIEWKIIVTKTKY